MLDNDNFGAKKTYRSIELIWKEVTKERRRNKVVRSKTKQKTVTFVYINKRKLLYLFRNCCVHMPFQSASSKMVVRKCCHCATKTASPPINNFATTIGFCWRKNVTVACHWKHEAISDCPTVKLFHVTINLPKHQPAHGLDLPKWIQKM